MTEISKKCPQCSALLPADAPEGLCPACLLRRGFASEPAAAPETETITPEIERLFPDLEIDECLGQGGMGVVYKARQKQLDRVVALKVMKADTAKDPAFAERFTREARALAKLDHPNIVSVFDFGQTEGRFYLLMEYVDGVNLRHVIRSNSMKPKEALEIVPKICQALQYAHDQGVVHRDIKPENILVDKAGRVMIADFGLAKIVGLGESNYTLTQEGVTMGTVRYMAPEQMDNPQEVDHRADIYSLGVVFYEMLTGEVPMGRFAPPSRKVEVDVRLDEVVLRSLEREPEHRFQKVSDVKTEVESIVGEPLAKRAIPAAETELSGLALWGAGLAAVGLVSGVVNIAILSERWLITEVWLFLLITLVTGVSGSLCGFAAVHGIRNSRGRLSGMNFAAGATLCFPLLLIGGFLHRGGAGLSALLSVFVVLFLGWALWRPLCRGEFGSTEDEPDESIPKTSMKAVLGLLLGSVGSLLIVVLTIKFLRVANLDGNVRIPSTMGELSAARMIFTVWVVGLGIASPVLGWQSIRDIRMSAGRLEGQDGAFWASVLMPSTFVLLASLSVAALGARFLVQEFPESNVFALRALTLGAFAIAVFIVFAFVKQARKVLIQPAKEPVGPWLNAAMTLYCWTLLLVGVVNLIVPLGEWVVLGLHALMFR